MNTSYQLGERIVPVAVTPRPDADGVQRFVVSIAGHEREVDVLVARGGRLTLRIDGAQVTAWAAADGDERWVALAGGPTVRFLCGAAGGGAGARAHRGGGDESLRATMHGQVVQVAVAEGDTVEAGQLLVVLEAMKMEVLVTAPHDGTVTRVGCAVKDVVERGQVLVELEGTS